MTPRPDHGRGRAWAQEWQHLRAMPAHPPALYVRGKPGAEEASGRAKRAEMGQNAGARALVAGF